MFYDSASCAAIPSLYICHIKNVLGSVPMISCFVAGNTKPTIPHLFRGQQGRAGWATDTRPDSGEGSCLYKLHLWLWHYGRGQERMVSVLRLQAMEERAKCLRESLARAGKTVKGRRLAAITSARSGRRGCGCCAVNGKMQCQQMARRRRECCQEWHTVMSRRDLQLQVQPASCVETFASYSRLFLCALPFAALKFSSFLMKFSLPLF